MNAALRTLTLAAIVLLTVWAPAEARINGPRLDSFSVGCGMLQDESDQLVAEYRNASNARREEILIRLRQIGQTWIDIGCKTVFGDISLRVQPQPRLPVGVPIVGAVLAN